MEISFEELRKEIIDLLNQKDTMVLATSANDRVTARTMSCINKGLNVFFQTDKNFKKVKQLEKNPNVALSIDNIQIEGKALKRGHPLDETNNEFLKSFKENHYDSYKKYTHLEDEIVIKVEPHLIILWKYIDDKCCRDFLYVEENKTERKYYNINN
jgi:uncharacterized pyridoxamine 5'-phosphate oxidase family protein